MTTLKDLIAKATKGLAVIDREGLHGDLRGHIPVAVGKHGGFAQFVWKMDDDERSPQCEATTELFVELWNSREAIAKLIEAAEAVGAHPFIYFGTDTLPGPDSGQHKIAALRKALEAVK